MIAYLLWMWTGRNWFDRNLSLKEIERRLAEVKAQIGAESGHGHLSHTCFDHRNIMTWLKAREARLEVMRRQALSPCN